ncbi:hypothetical protein KAW55_07605 [bacterium]|nr:hypothetical protein [bacterium]
MLSYFPTGKPVSGRDLVGRKKEIQQVLDLVKGGQSVILIAPRRFGKTSIILSVLDRLRREKYLIGDTDLFNTTSKADLAEHIIEETLKNDRIPIRRIIKNLKANLITALKNIEIKKITDTYEVVLSLADKGADEERLLDEALDFPQIYAKKKKKKMVFSYDEFGDLFKWNGRDLLKKMRAKLQRHTDVTYIFSGSQESLMTRLFLNKAEAFYRFGRIIPIKAVPVDEFKKYIKETYARLGISIENYLIDNILKKSQCHPYYTQLLCQLIYFSVKGEKNRIEEKDIFSCFEEVLLKEKSGFDNIWLSLMEKKNHTEIISAIAKGMSPYNLGKLGRQNINRILTSLEAMGLIERIRRGEYEIRDRFFKEYILRKYEE